MTAHHAGQATNVSRFRCPRARDDHRPVRRGGVPSLRSGRTQAPGMPTRLSAAVLGFYRRTDALPHGVQPRSRPLHSRHES